MQPTFVLVHSPSVGPMTWAPVANRLHDLGHDSIVPSLLDVADADPPYWPRVVEKVTAAMNRLASDQPVVLVAHSNAGLFVPLLVTHATRPVYGCLFVDAALPASAGSTPVAPAELLDFLREKVTGGKLPPWTEWWDEKDIAPMFPNRDLRAAVTAEQPRLPLTYYEQQVPVPASWDHAPCGYLIFGPPYDEVAEEARRRGWLVDELPGQHLHQIVDPDATTDRLVTMVQRLTAAPDR